MHFARHATAPCLALEMISELSDVKGEKSVY